LGGPEATACKGVPTITASSVRYSEASPAAEEGSPLLEALIIRPCQLSAWRNAFGQSVRQPAKGCRYSACIPLSTGRYPFNKPDRTQSLFRLLLRVSYPYCAPRALVKLARSDSPPRSRSLSVRDLFCCGVKPSPPIAVSPRPLFSQCLEAHRTCRGHRARCLLLGHGMGIGLRCCRFASEKSRRRSIGFCAFCTVHSAKESAEVAKWFVGVAGLSAWTNAMLPADMVLHTCPV